jgi:hypothetical protein
MEKTFSIRKNKDFSEKDVLIILEVTCQFIILFLFFFRQGLAMFEVTFNWQPSYLSIPPPPPVMGLWK